MNTNDLEEDLQRLLDTKRRLVSRSLAEAQDLDKSDILRWRAIDLLPQICDYIDFLSYHIPEGKTASAAKDALGTLDLLLISLELLANVGFTHTVADRERFEKLNERMKVARAGRTPAQRYDDIVDEALSGYISKHGPFEGKTGAMLRLLAPEIEARLAKEGLKPIGDSALTKKIRAALGRLNSRPE